MVLSPNFCKKIPAGYLLAIVSSDLVERGGPVALSLGGTRPFNRKIASMTVSLIRIIVEVPIPNADEVLHVSDLETLWC